MSLKVPEGPAMSPLMTEKQVADALQLTEKTLRNWRSDGRGELRWLKVLLTSNCF
jgi:hypothetical protein